MAGARAIARVVVGGRPGRLDLIECHALLNHGLHAIPNNPPCWGSRRHPLNRSDAVPWNNQRAAFGAKLGDRQVEDAIQAVDHTIDGAASLDIDNRVGGGKENSPAAITSDAGTRPGYRRRCAPTTGE